jgi:DNA-binding GntR family transcriptional regulator
VTTAVTLIRDQLRSAILEGELVADGSMTQSDLAERFGVSRTPLREALRMLELEGWVLRESNGRFRTAPTSIDDIEELAVMRISLEAIAVRLTVPTFGIDEHAELEGLLAQIERFASTEDWTGAEAPHRVFHQRIVSGSGDRIVDLLSRLWDRAARYRSASFGLTARSPSALAIRRAEHRAIVDAFEANDPAQAASVLATQIGRTALEVAAVIDPEHSMTRVRATLASHTGSETIEAFG